MKQELYCHLYKKIIEDIMYSGKSKPFCKGLLTLFIAVFFTSFQLQAQTLTCPPNLNFEQGNFSNWVLYTGTPPNGGCCPINTPSISSALWWRFAITSGNGTDPYGGFPVVAPGGGVYSLKLGNIYGGAEAERARYYINVPSGVNNYSIIFRYAVVFEDPNHVSSQQPRFEVKAFDSATNAAISCAQFTYISTANLPGFIRSTVDTLVWYKSWTTASIDLSGYAGKTIALDFASGDCSQGGHFGYGYVDMNCGLFQISGVTCSTTPTVTLSAPPGFWKYYWRDSATFATVDSGQTVTISTPSATTTYAVILVPYTGFGCPDTLYTTVNISNITTNATKDTTICQGGNLQLSAGASGASPLAYSWTPSTGLNCTTCANPVATPTANITYIVTVNDSNNCPKKDTVSIFVDSLNISLTPQNATCGNPNGGISTTVLPGKPPYTYAWNTSPVQNTATAANLAPGTYTVIVKDSIGCSKTDSATVSQAGMPPAVIVSKTNISCKGGNNGTATAIVSSGAPPYTYSWNTTPVKTTATITNLMAGTYVVTVTDSAGCTKTDTVVITEPDSLHTNVSVVNVPCYGGNSGTATVTASGGKFPYSYAWNSSPAQTTATATGLTKGTYVVVVTDSNGCTRQDTADVTAPDSILLSVTGLNAGCAASANGSATAVASGGTAPYNYSWNTSPAQTTATASALVAGTYSVTVTDSNGCTKTGSITITAPDTLNANIATTPVSCNGGNNGSATVTVTGGTMPYSYSWNTSPVQTSATASNLPAGTYVVTVSDSNGCFLLDTAVVVQPDLLSIATSKADVACYNGNNGTATVTASGGKPPYSYSWNTSPAQTTATATGLTAGTYIATVTDSNGCSKADTVTIDQPPLLQTSVSVVNVPCYGGSNGLATVVASGGKTPYTYSWNTTPSKTTAIATGLLKGTYIVTVTDSNGCIRQDTADVTQPDSLILSVAGSNANCSGSANGSATASVSGGTAPYSYSWSTSPAQTTATATSLAAGTYSVTVTDSNGCAKTGSITINAPGTLNTDIIESNVTCNGGNNGIATVTATGGTTPYSYSWNTTPAQTSATATNLPAGSYIVTVTDSNGCVRSDTAIVTQPDILTTNAARTDVTCNNGNNGTATVTAAGGTMPYAYSWNTSPIQTTATATGLSAGTYVVTVKDSNLCVKLDTVTVIQPGMLTATAGSTNVNCFSGNNGTATVVASGGIPPYSYTWNTSPVQTTVNATNLSAGTYVVTVTDSNSCEQKDTVVVSQPAQLVTGVTVTNAGCNSAGNGAASVTVSGGVQPYTYSWNTSPVKTTPTAGNLTAGTYIITVTDSNGCIQKDTAHIAQPAELDALVATVNVSCYGGNNGSATVTVSGGTIPYKYNWNTVPAQTTATAINLPAGSYTVTVTDSNGCSTQGNITISEPMLLNTGMSYTPVSCFNGNDGSATVTASGGVQPYAYTWNTSPPQTTTKAVNLPAGTYFVTVKDSNNCSRNDTVVITQPQPLSVSAAATGVLCHGGNNGAAYVSAGGGTPAYTYSWNTSPVQTLPAASGLTAGPYIVSVTDSNGCTGADTVIVTEPAPILSAISPQDVKCFGDSSGTASVIVTGGTPGYSYSWTTTPAQTTSLATGLAAGTYAVAIKDSNGCNHTDTVTIYQPAVLKVAGSTVNVKCSGDSTGSATAVVTGGIPPYAYTWNTIPAQSTAVATMLPAGVYTVAVTDSNGCSAMGTDTITQPAVLDTRASGIASSCLNASTGIATAKVSGGTPSYNIRWNTNPVQTGDTVKNLYRGEYVSYATDANGCIDSDRVVIGSLPEVNLVAGPDSSICPGDSIKLSATGAVSYLWSPPSGLSCTTCAMPSAAPAGTIAYTVTGVDANNCHDTDYVTISVAQKNPVSAGPDINICDGDSAQLSAYGGETYSWYPGKNLDNNTSSNPVVTTDSSMKYRVVIKSGKCFVDTLYQSVFVHTRPSIELGPDLEGIPGAWFQLHAETVNATSILWDPATGLSCVTCYDPVATVNNTTTYRAVVSNGDMCFAEDNITIKVACDNALVFIPNTFTPNGDGLNDYFFVSAKGINNINLLRIYSRWGELLFEARNIQPNDQYKGWDGTYKTDKLSPDVFVYYVEIQCSNGRAMLLKGDISLVR